MELLTPRPTPKLEDKMNKLKIRIQIKNTL
jgi:hypothetical protein